MQREICLHLVLDHPHIIKLHAAFNDEHNNYMVQELATGGDLFSRQADHDSVRCVRWDGTLGVFAFLSKPRSS